MKDAGINNGFITLHRKFTEWEWYDDANTMRLFLHCLFKANWKDSKWRGNEIKRGSFITSLGMLSEELALSRKQVMRALDKLISTGELSKKGTAWTHITVCKYDSYQDDQQNEGTGVAPQREQEGNRKGTGREQDGNRMGTGWEQEGIQLNKNNKNNKENKNNKNNKEERGKQVSPRAPRFEIPSIEEVKKEFLRKTENESYSKSAAESFFNFYDSKGWMVGKNKMKKWEAAVAMWFARDKNEGKVRVKEAEREMQPEFHKANGDWFPRERLAEYVRKVGMPYRWEFPNGKEVLVQYTKEEIEKIMNQN